MKRLVILIIFAIAVFFLVGILQYFGIVPMRCFQIPTRSDISCFYIFELEYWLLLIGFINA